MNSNVLFVAGMHRSGTSVMAQWLHYNGLFIGDRLLSGFSDNKHGHFEDVDFLDLLIEELRIRGLHESGLILKGRKDFVLSGNIGNVLVQLIRQRNESHTTWGWKEPRSTLFIQSLKQLIPTLKIVAVHRHPGLVIESLYKRLRKNKWYYTRNPVKKLKWYLDIDLNPEKWIRIFEEAYCQYNVRILKFREEYPDDLFTIDSSELFKRETELQQWIYERAGIKMESGFKEVFDESIYTRASSLKDGRIPKAIEIYTTLVNG